MLDYVTMRAILFIIGCGRVDATNAAKHFEYSQLLKKLPF